MFRGIMFMIIVFSLLSYFNLQPFSARIFLSDNPMKYHDTYLPIIPFQQTSVRAQGSGIN